MISKFNVYLKVNQHYYSVNLCNWRLIELEDATYNNLLNKNEQSIPDRIKKKLVFDGLLIPEKVNELNLFLDRYYKTIYSRRLNLTILASTQCNFNCKYCYENFSNYSIDRNFVDSLKKYIEKNITKYDSLFIEWFGGEPLIKKRELISLSNAIKLVCKNKKIPYVGSIVTNGFLLDESTFSDLIDSNIVFFQITIDGSEKSHNFLRPLKNGKPTYNGIINNLIDIKNRIQNNKFFKIVIRNNVYKGNLEEVKDFSVFFNENFRDDKRFFLFQFPISNWGGQKIKELEPYLLKKNRIPIAKGAHTYTSFGESFASRICYAAMNNGFAIDPQLNVYKCHHYIMRDSNKISHNNMGKIDNNGNFIINAYNQSSWNIREYGFKCNKCSLLPYCLLETCPIYPLNSYPGCYEKTLDTIKLNIKSYVSN